MCASVRVPGPMMKLLIRCAALIEAFVPQGA
jgi:hypothetical protein